MSGYINFKKATHHEELLPEGQKWKEPFANLFLLILRGEEDAE